MNVNEVIKYPILSEKTYAQMANGIYAFAVDVRTNKVEVKKTIEFIFEVKVKKVNIINIDKKPKKLGKYNGFTNKVKKAIITLSEGQINIYPDDVEKVSKSKNPKAELENDDQKKISEIEKKAADKIAAKTKKPLIPNEKKEIKEKIVEKPKILKSHDK